MQKIFITLALVVTIGAVLFFSLRKNNNPSQTTAPTEEKQTTQLPPAAEINKNINPNLPTMVIDQNKTYTAKMKTSAGEIDIQLNAKATPITVNNFVS